MSVPQLARTEIAELVFKDDLTGLHNRRFLYRTFEEDWDEWKDGAEQISLAIVDLDYFKQVNDTHGHLTGDLVLSETATLLESSISGEDRAIRYGGDEFILLLPGRSKGESGEIAEALRRAMADKEFVSKEEQQPLEVVLSFSIGVATFPEDGSVGEELMAAADKALYASKKAGRNRVTLAGEIPAGLEDEIDLYRTFPSKSLVGRTELIETLSEICDLVGPGMGTWTALSGSPGVGKSRLLYEALRLAPESGASTVLVSLAEDLKDQAFAGIGRLYTEIAGRHQRVFQQLSQLQDPAFLHFMRGHAPEAVPVTDDSAESAEPPAGDRLRDAILASLVELCEERRWLFLVDDAACLDPHSCELLRAAIEDKELPLGVVSTHRNEDYYDEEQPGIAFLHSLVSRSWLDQIVVEPLSLEATRVLITVLLPNKHAPDDFEATLHELTGGNPLFIEEVLRIGIASEKISRRGEDWFVQSMAREDYPETLEEAIQRRLSFLDDEIGEGIARASAMGNTLTADVLQTLLGQNEGEILDFLDKAREQGFLQGGRQGDLSNLSFASGTLRDLAYRRMDSADRTKVHREIGKIEEHRAGSLVGVLASRLAYHFERGKVYEKARTYLESARLTAPTIIVAGSEDLTGVPKHRRRRITEAAIPLPDDSLLSLDDAIRAIAHASKSLWMYPQGSPIVTAAFCDLHEQLEKLFEHAEVISLADVEGGLVVNGIPYPVKRQEFLVKGLLEQLRSRELSGVTLRKGMTEEEAVFLVEQLATDEPVERDPEAWEAILRQRQIENVDFGDRVYIRADGVASAVGSLSAEQLREAQVVRMAPGSKAGEPGSGIVTEFPTPGEGADGAAASGEAVSAEDLQALLDRLDKDAALDEEIESLVPTVAELLKKLLEAADQATKMQHQGLTRLLGLEQMSGAEPTATKADSEPRNYLDQIETEWDPGQQKELLGPAEEKFEAFVMSRDLVAARKILRFTLMCRTFDDGDGDLAAEAAATLTRMATGGTVQLLLADLLARPEQPDTEALALLRELGDEASRPLVTFLRETDDLRARRIVAELIKEIGGTTLQASLETVTHGENPAVARRVISVLDVLSDDPVRDLSRAIRVRSAAVMGEAIKVLQRQTREDQVKVIGMLTQSASPELVCRGIYYLSEWSLDELTGRLLELIEQSESAEIVVGAVAAAARLKIAEAVPLLGKMLGKKQIMGLAPAYSRTIRREFARALASMGTSEARHQLAVFVKDIDLEVRNIARGMPEPTGP